VYYFYAALALGAPDRSIAFSVPTGNFGNVYAGDVARRMGLPLARLTIASNRNDILTRFHHTGTMRVGTVVPTLSPSMDIQVSSNFERLLYELLDRDGDQVAALMDAFRTDGEFKVDAEPWERFRNQFDAHRFDDRETVECIADLFRRTGACLDPHSAVGVAAIHGFETAPRWPTVCLATAHPGKFPEALATLADHAIALPPRLAELRHREERFEILPNDLSAVKSFVAAMARP
jgi:threonine synthase